MRSKRQGIVTTRKRPEDALLVRHLQRWLAEGRKRWRPATSAMYESLLDVHVAPAFKRRKLGSIASEDVREWQRDMVERGVGAVTRRRAQQMVAQALRPLVDRGDLPRNPFLVARLPKAKAPDVRVPTEAEVLALLRHCDDPQIRAMLLLAVTALLRIGEILALRLGDLDLKRGTIAVSSAVSRNPARKPLRRPSREAPPRELSIPPVTVAAIRAHLARKRKGLRGDPLFSRSGVPWDRHNFRNRAWQPLLKAAGVRHDLHFDALRHAGSGLLLKAGLPVHAVAKRARLADSRMLLERHGEPTPEKSDDATAKAANRLFRDILDE